MPFRVQDFINWLEHPDDDVHLSSAAWDLVAARSPQAEAVQSHMARAFMNAGEPGMNWEADMEHAMHLFSELSLGGAAGFAGSQRAVDRSGGHGLGRSPRRVLHARGQGGSSMWASSPWSSTGPCSSPHSGWWS